MSRSLLDNEQHFKLIYKSKIIETDEKTYTYQPISVAYNPHNYSHIDQVSEDVIAIKMPRSEYYHFMRNYGAYLDLIYGLSDPTIKDMFEKMMVLIQLKK